MWSKVIGMFLIALSKTTRGESEDIPPQHKTHPILEIDWNEGTSIPETLLERDDFKLNPPGANRTIHTGLEEVDENLHAPSDENRTTQIPFLTTSETSASIEHLDAPPTSSDEETTEESRDNILDLFSVEEEDNFFIPFNPKDQEVQFFQSAKKGKTKRKPEVVKMNGIITSRAKVSLDSTLSNDNTELQEDLTSESSDPNRNKTSHLEKHDQQDFGSESSDQHHNATNHLEKKGRQEVTLDNEHIDFKVFSEGSEKVPKALGDTTTSQKNPKDSQSTQRSELLNSNTKTNDDREKVQLDSQSHADVSEGHSENVPFSSNYSVTEEVLELKHLDDNHKLPSVSDEYKSDHNYSLNIYSLDSSSSNTTFSPFKQEQLAYFVPNLEDVLESGQNSSQNTFLDPFFIPVMHYDPSTLLPNRSEEPPAKDKETNTTTPKADLVALSSALAIDWGDMPAQYAVNPDFLPYRSTKYAFPYTTSLQNHDPTPSGPLNTQDALDQHNDRFHVSDKRPIKLPTGKVYKNSKTFRDFGSDTKALHQLNHDPGSDEMFDNDSKSVTASENDNESVRMSDNDSTSFELSDSDPVSGEVSGNVGESSKILRSSGQIFRSSRYYSQDSISSNHTSPFQRLFRHSKGHIRPFRYFNPTSFESKKIFKSNHSSSTSNHSGNESASLKGASSDPKSFKGLTIDSEGHNVTLSLLNHLSLLNYSNSNPLKDVSDYSKLLEAKDNDTKTFSDTEHEPRSTEDLDHDDSIKFVDYFEYEGQPGEDENTTSKAIDPHMDISLEAQDKEDTPESALRHLRAIPLHLGIPKIPSFFAFKYLVDDLEGNYFGHQEARDIYSAKGKYFVLLPDGRLQTVNYLANRTGYFPHIVYTPGKGISARPHSGFGNVFAPGPTFSPTPHPLVVSTGIRPFSSYVTHPLRTAPIVTTPLPPLGTHLSSHIPVGRDLFPTIRETPLVDINPPVFRFFDSPLPVVSPLPPVGPLLPLLPDENSHNPGTDSGLPNSLPIPLTQNPLHQPLLTKPPLRKYHLTTTPSPDHKHPTLPPHHPSFQQNTFLSTVSPLDLTTVTVAQNADHEGPNTKTSLHSTTSSPQQLHPKPVTQHPPITISNFPHPRTTSLPSFHPAFAPVTPFITDALPIPPGTLPARTTYPTTLSIRGLPAPKLENEQGSSLIKITPKSVPQPLSQLKSEVIVSTTHPTPAGNPPSKSFSYVQFSPPPKLLPIPVPPHSAPVPITYLPKSTLAHSLAPGLRHRPALQVLATSKPFPHELHKNGSPTTPVSSQGNPNPTLKTLLHPATKHPSSTSIPDLTRNLKKPGGFQSLRSGPAAVFPNRLGLPPLDFQPLFFQPPFQTGSPGGSSHLGGQLGRPPFSAYLNAEQMILKNPRFHFFNPFSNDQQHLMSNLFETSSGIESSPHVGMIPHPLLQLRRSFMAPFVTIPLPLKAGESRGLSRGQTSPDSTKPVQIAGTGNHKEITSQQAVLAQLEDYDEAAKDYL